MTKTKIEWCDESWNPLRGCSRVSDGCQNCYAESVAWRFKKPGMAFENLIAKGGQWNGSIKLLPEKLEEPLHWKKPRRIFVNSMSDLFHENVPFDFIDKVFAVMASASQHNFIVLTKRPARMLEYMTNEFTRRNIFTCALQIKTSATILNQWPLSNIKLGVSVEDQKTADERIPLLLKTPATFRLISAEPLLGPINLTRGVETRASFENWLSGDKFAIAELANQFMKNLPTKIDWVIAGGESGHGARPSHPDWFRGLRDQCKASNTPFFFKQWGLWAPQEQNPDRKDWAIVSPDGGFDIPDCRAPDKDLGELAMVEIGKKKAGNTLDGKQHLELAQ